MATVPVTRTWVAGEVVTAAFMNNNITAVLGWLLAPAICQVRQLVAQSLANGAHASITYTGEDVDSTGMHSTSVNTSRLTAVYPGWYGSSGTLCVATGAAATRRGGRYTVNGANVTGGSTLVGAGATGTLEVPCKLFFTFLNVGDYLEFQGFQESGGALNTVSSGINMSTLSSWWMSN